MLYSSAANATEKTDIKVLLSGPSFTEATRKADRVFQVSTIIKTYSKGCEQ